MSISVGCAPQKALLEWEKQSEIRTIPRLFERTADEAGDRPMLLAKVDGQYRARSWNHVRQAVEALSCALIELGIGLEDRIAQLSGNRPEWVITDLAILSAGAVHVPIYPTLAPEAVAYLLRDCGASVVMVATQAQLLNVLSIAEHTPDLRHVIVYDDITPPAHDGLKIWKFADLVALGERRKADLANERKRRCDALTASSVASLVYTSGTTGEPKGAMLTHGNFVSNATTVTPLMEITANDIELSFLPLCHVFERVAYYAAVTSGATIYYAESVEKVPANLVEVHPTLVPSVPRVFEKIHARIMEGVESGSGLKKKIFWWAMSVGRAVRTQREAGKPVTVALKAAHAIAHKLVFSKIHERTGGRIRVFISGGAPLRRDIAEFFSDVGLKICEGYGLTETSPVITFNRPNAIRFGTVGQPIPFAEVKIADDGEILARGPNIMLGYFNKPEDTRAAVDEEGWFHTGDIGRLDENQFLTITDRKKELLVMSNGKNVAPQPIENLLKTSNFIEQAMVVGDNRNYVTALIVPNFTVLETWARANGINERGSALANNAQVLAHYESLVTQICRELSQYEKVKKVALLEQELTQERGELTPTLKFKRREILKRYREKVDAMYATPAN